MAIVQTPERIATKEKFVKTHQIASYKRASHIPKSIVDQARKEIGYSKNTIKMDIQWSLWNFARDLKNREPINQQ